MISHASDMSRLVMIWAMWRLLRSQSIVIAIAMPVKYVKGQWSSRQKMGWHRNCRARLPSARNARPQLDWLSTSACGRMLAERYHGCNCVMGRCKCVCFCMTLRKNAHCILHHCIPPASLQLRTGPTWATWSSVHAICEDSGFATWKESGIMMWDNDKKTMSCSWVGKEGGRLWGEGARRACLLPTEGRSAGPSTFASVFCAPLSSCLPSQSSF